MELEKMAVKAQAETRANLYRIVTDALEVEKFPTQPIKGGRLIDLGNGYYGKVSISIIDPSNVEPAIQAYADQMRINAARAAERAEREAEKARKAAERAAKREEKTE